MSLAFIGGTGLYQLPGLEEVEWATVDTPFGAAELLRGEWQGRQALFLPRHGRDHRWPPHRVPYRAHIAALKQQGVTGIVAISACGTLAPGLPPGSLVLLTDLVDWTHGRAVTFFDGPPQPVVHVDVSNPYCPRLRRLLRETAVGLHIPIAEGAVYACTEGPRFETPAEIRALRLLGADLVGMTGVPEATLAREAEICYAAVAVATNWAAGTVPETLTHSEVEEMMAHRQRDLRRLLGACLLSYTPDECACRHALDEYRLRSEGLGVSIVPRAEG